MGERCWTWLTSVGLRLLQHGCVVQFGRVYKFRFLDPAHDDKLRVRQPSRPDVSQLEG